jgi:hypothetical protein
MTYWAWDDEDGSEHGRGVGCVRRCEQCDVGGEQHFEVGK